jgi:hypothetical protein
VRVKDVFPLNAELDTGLAVVVVLPIPPVLGFPTVTGAEVR